MGNGDCKTSQSRGRLLVRALPCLLGLNITGALAEPLQACTRPLSVAFYAIPPYYYHGADSTEWRGIDRDLIDELARRTGCRFEQRFESRVRIWQQLEAGSLDLSASAIQTPERDRFARFIPYTTERNLVAVRSSAPASTNASTVLTDPALSLAITRGYRYGPPFDSWIDTLKRSGRVVEAADEEAALRLVTIGRADAAIVRDSAWRLVSRLYPTASLRRLDVGAPVIEVNLVLSRAQIGTGLYDRFNAAITSLKRDGSLRRIVDRHVSPDSPRAHGNENPAP
ncbi:substrate-binding periplasmic protein [Niveibacterium sp.]|uniref:substrate-binding periplasmic protein n=1 Tax=Niveibacterium sp. TaxID=2017444 RepID=UPI0035B0044D